MDEADQAQQYSEFFLATSLDACLSQTGGGESLKYCEDCDCEIPQARRVAVPGCTRCVSCQDKHERL